MPIAKALMDRKVKAQAFIDSLISNDENVIKWSGQRKLKNPQTDEVVGLEKTRNLDVIVPDEMQTKLSDLMEKLSGTGEYIRNTFGKATELIAIKCRENSKGQIVLQYAKENVNTVNAQSEEIDEFFEGDAVRMKVDVDTGEVTDKVDTKVAEDKLTDF